jgi:hypothetical protein
MRVDFDGGKATPSLSLQIPLEEWEDAIPLLR